MTPNKKSVILSEQIRMAFGYPDGWKYCEDGDGRK